MKLTEKQKRFADYYIETGNATEAYERSYMCKRSTADTNGPKLLGNTRIKQYIDERIEEKNDEQIAKQDEVLRYLTKVMRREEKEHQVVTLKRSRSWYEDGKKHTLEEEVAEVVEIPSRLTDSNKAAELLGKRYVMWTDKTDLNMSGDLEINVTLSDDDE